MSVIPKSYVLAISAMVSGAASNLVAQGNTIQFPATMMRSQLPQLAGAPKGPTGIAVGDINGDLLPDLVYSGIGGGGVYLQGKASTTSTAFAGMGRFFDITGSQPNANPPNAFGLASLDCELADLDGDGDLDVLMATGNQGLLVIPSFNDGSGQFTAGTAFNSAAGFFNAEDIEAGDVDGDGDVDVVVGTSVFPGIPATQLLLFLNTGTGTFVEAAANIPLIAGDSQMEVELFDADGDGDLDMFVAQDSGVAPGAPAASVFLNNVGAGVFVIDGGPTTGGYGNATSVDTGDVNGDGLIDILVATSNSGCYLQLNTGGEEFINVPLALPTAFSTFNTARLVDVDEDCALDIICSYGTSSTPTQLWRGDGDGGFVADPTQIYDDRALIRSALAVADIDVDGDSDVITGSWADMANPIAIRYNNLRDFDAPIETLVGATSLTTTQSFVPGTGLGLASSFVAYDFAAAAAFTELQLPQPRNPCGLPTGNILGLPPTMNMLGYAVVFAPGGTRTLTIPPGLAGLELFMQAGYVSPATLEVHLVQTTRTLIQ